MTMSIGNAPCSWGTLEFEGLAGERVPWETVLDEVRETGYTACALGDWEFMPTDPVQLAAAFNVRQLAITDAFIPVRLKDPAALEDGIHRAVRSARLLAAVARLTGQRTAPFIVLADDNGTDLIRTEYAGRITLEMGLTTEEWSHFAAGCNAIAEAVLQESGLRTVFHHHCAGYVETPGEIERLLALTDPARVGLVFDTGHYVFGAGEATTIVDFLERNAARIWYMHFKECSTELAGQSRSEGWNYFTALQHGIFGELGQGAVDFAGVAAWLRRRNYDDVITVEQDVLPGMGAPKASARRNREFLHSIGL